jgi:cytochrome c553
LKLRSKFISAKSARAQARTWTVGALAAAALFLAGCRLDMHIQPKYLPYEPTDFFADGRSERQPVPGTVARGHLRLDELMYTGRENGVVADKFPFPITKADLDRGRERYNVYCTPCHDYSGTGRGMIVQRGFPQPPSYHIQRLRDAPAGHFFEVMTNGFGAMYSYAARIEPADRWRIAAYIRVLQLSRNAKIDDVPATDRASMSHETADNATPAPPPANSMMMMMKKK